jgi:site-specific recombinase XerD
MELLEEFARTPSETRIDESQKNYVTKCRAFLAWLGTEAELSEFTTRNGQDFTARLGDADRPATVKTYIASLRAFGAWLVSTGRLPQNPMSAIRPPKLDAPRREVPTDKQVEAMLAACRRIANPFRQALARATLSVLVFSAMRRRELLALQLTDIDLSAGKIEIRHGKGNRPRSLYVGEECCDALSAYLKLRPDCPEKKLFLVRKGQYLGNDGLRMLIRQVLTAADLEGCRALLPHGLRHNAASYALREGFDMKRLQVFLGHARMSTTEVYVHVDEDGMKDAPRFFDRRRTPNPPDGQPQPPRQEGEPPRQEGEPPVQRPTLRLWKEEEQG